MVNLKGAHTNGTRLASFCLLARLDFENSVPLGLESYVALVFSYSQFLFFCEFPSAAAITAFFVWTFLDNQNVPVISIVDHGDFGLAVWTFKRTHLESIE